MMNISIATIPDTFLQRVRTAGLDDLGQSVVRRTAAGGEPLRDVLRRARPGEELILCSFTPFSQAGPYREFGPIFVLANPSEEVPARAVLPIADDDSSFLQTRFVIRAYAHDGSIADAKLVERAEAREVVQAFLGDDDVAFLHVRFPTYGCFACRIDRAA